MAENRDAEVDPRFDPMFQRGYDPKVHGGRRPRVAPRHGTEPVPIVSFRERPAASSAEPVVRGAVERTPTDVAAADTAAAVEPASEVDEQEVRGLNPFRLALLVASVAAIGGAALLIWHRLTSDPYGTPYTTEVWALFWQQMGDSILVPLLTGGLIGLAVWLGLVAVSPRKSRHE
jgi:hypothetical protein